MRKPRNLPKKLKLKEPWVVCCIEEDKILGWFTNVNGAYKVMAGIELFGKDHAKETGHSVVIARGFVFY